MCCAITGVQQNVLNLCRQWSIIPPWSADEMVQTANEMARASIASMLCRGHSKQNNYYHTKTTLAYLHQVVFVSAAFFSRGKSVLEQCPLSLPLSVCLKIVYFERLTTLLPFQDVTHAKVIAHSCGLS